MNSRRTLGVVLIAALPFAAACGAGRNTTTDKERQSPYVASGDAGSLLVTAASLVPSQAGTTDASATTTTPTPTPSAGNLSSGTPNVPADGYLVVSIVNRGSTPDELTGVIVQGATVTPDDESSQALTVPPSRAVTFGDPEFGSDGNFLQLNGLTQPLSLGASMPVTFQFRDAGSVTLQVPVRAAESYGTTATSTPLPLTGSYPSGSETPETLPTGG
jgi:copper(I)-binding protein